MARKLRIQYEGAIYHLMSRGDRREDIFRDDHDRRCFIYTLDEACEKTRWEVLAYCLMPNHFHLVVETPQANLVAGMQWLLSTYTSRFNRRHQLNGHLFSGRYKSQIVDGSGNGYLRTVCDYVHLNPARAHLLKPEQKLHEYVWSSYPQYLMAPTERYPWLKVQRVLGELGITKDTKAGRIRIAEYMEKRRLEEENPEILQKIQQSWCFGGEEFRKTLLAEVEEMRGPNHSGELWRESQMAHAERLIQELLKEHNWSEHELDLRPKTDPIKVEIAGKVRSATVMSMSWLAQRLRMGSIHTIRNALQKLNKIKQTD